MQPASQGGSCERGKVSTLWGPCHWLGNQSGEKWSLEESVATDLQQAGQRETSIDHPGHPPSLLGLRYVSPGVCSASA